MINHLRSGILVKHIPSNEFYFLSHFVNDSYSCYGYAVNANQYYIADCTQIAHSSYFDVSQCELLVEQLPIYNLNEGIRSLAKEMGDYVVPVKFVVGELVTTVKLKKTFEIVGYKTAPGKCDYLYTARSTDLDNRNECFDFFDTEITREVKTGPIHPFSLLVPPMDYPLLSNLEIFFLLLKSFAQSVLQLLKR